MIFLAIISCFFLPLLFLMVGYGKVTKYREQSNLYTFLGKLISFLLAMSVAFAAGYLQATL